MDDPFAVLGVPRRPALDQGVLKEKYLALAVRWHPDSADGDAVKFQQAREAFEILFDPAARIRRLLPDDFPAGATPDAGLFLRVGEVVQRAKALDGAPRSRASGLAGAVHTAECRDALAGVRRVLAEVEAAQAAALSDVDALDARWPDVSQTALADVAARLKFSARWLAELREWEFRLSQAAFAGKVPP